MPSVGCASDMCTRIFLQTHVMAGKSVACALPRVRHQVILLVAPCILVNVSLPCRAPGQDLGIIRSRVQLLRVGVEGACVGCLQVPPQRAQLLACTQAEHLRAAAALRVCTCTYASECACCALALQHSSRGRSHNGLLPARCCLKGETAGLPPRPLPAALAAQQSYPQCRTSRRCSAGHAPLTLCCASARNWSADFCEVHQQRSGASSGCPAVSRRLTPEARRVPQPHA